MSKYFDQKDQQQKSQQDGLTGFVKALNVSKNDNQDRKFSGLKDLTSSNKLATHQFNNNRGSASSFSNIDFTQFTSRKRADGATLVRMKEQEEHTKQRLIDKQAETEQASIQADLDRDIEQIRENAEFDRGKLKRFEQVMNDDHTETMENYKFVYV